MKKVLEMDGGDGCSAVQLYLILLNCILKNDLQGSWLAQWKEHVTLDLGVWSSIPMWGVKIT